MAPPMVQLYHNRNVNKNSLLFKVDYTSGTDLAIYEAAGKEKLLAERAGIGKIARGDIDSYIDANYVRESHRKEYPVRSRSNARMRGLTEERE